MTTQATTTSAGSIRTSEPTRTAHLVVGIGMSSRATAAEVRELVAQTFADHDLDTAGIAMIATRTGFVDDARLRIGPRIVGIEDARLEAASPPCTRAVGIRARVAETAARLAAAGPTHDLILARSAHVTLAIARVSSGTDGAAGG
jgi:hypothetical protein